MSSARQHLGSITACDKYAWVPPMCQALCYAGRIVMGQTDTVLSLGGEQTGKQAITTWHDECYGRGTGIPGILGRWLTLPKIGRMYVGKASWRRHSPNHDLKEKWELARQGALKAEGKAHANALR